jgi:hypothetical protein
MRRSPFRLALPQTNARATAVLVDEFYAGLAAGPRATTVLVRELDASSRD